MKDNAGSPMPSSTYNTGAKGSAASTERPAQSQNPTVPSTGQENPDDGAVIESEGRL
jgi:hypothetical protein